MNTQIIKGPKIYAENAVLENSAIEILNGKITNIGREFSATSNILEFPSNWHLIPGMIDMHIHGAAGADTMDATFDALDTISSALVQEGVTSFLAATISEESKAIEKALTTIAHYKKSKQEIIGAQILGINLESSFLSAEKHGCQNANYFAEPNIDLFKHWQKLADNLIKIVTIAPELEHSLDLIKYLHATSVIASLGHSNATYEQALKAIAAGGSQATHVFNGMRGIHHREPGIVTALLLSDKIRTEVIADGIHLHPAILQLIYKLKGADKIILVTDGVRAKYLKDGIYEFGGAEVIIKDNVAKLADGTLAGSVLRMDQALRNMLQFTDCNLKDAIKMIAENPAKQLNIFDRKGSIMVGKDADLVILDENFQVRKTIINGQILTQQLA
jgi:N-acetylglucosamine-6-phosphate deacetylase